jgi:hypothetical protein
VIPSSYQSIPEWQRLVATNVNPILTEYIIDSAKLTYSGNAHKLLRINSTADGVELSSDLDSVTLSYGGTQVAATATTGIDLSSGKALSVNGTQVVTARKTGWSADTGTDKRTANATYTAGSTLTFTDPPTASEMSSLATRIGNIETALQNASRTQKSLKADLTSHGLLGA